MASASTDRRLWAVDVLLVALFGAVFLGEQLSVPNWLGVALIAGGAILVAYKG